MKRSVIGKKVLSFVCMLLLPAFVSVKAQQPLVLDLEKALEIAMSENPTVKVADQEIEKRKYAKKGSYAALFPQIGFSADYTRTLKKQVMYMDFDMSSLTDLMGGGETSPGGETSGSGTSDGFEVGRDNNWSMGFNAGMPLINASLWKSLSISGLDVELAIEQARASKIDMENQVKKSFYRILLANDSYRVFKDSYDNAMENYQDIKMKFDAGLVAEYDLIRADVTVKNHEPNVLQAQNAVTLSKWQLKALLGMELDIPIECQGQLTDFQTDLFSDYLSADVSLSDNTTLKQMDIQANQLKQTILLQKYDYLPTLSLTSLYQWNSMNNDFKFSDYKWNPYSMLGVSLSVPIFSGGSKWNKIKQSKVSMLQLDLQKENTERNLQLAVRQYMDDMSTCIKRFDAAKKGVEQAERGYAISQKRYDTGATTLLELNDAELAMTQAKLNYNQAIFDYVTAKADLEKIVSKRTY